METTIAKDVNHYIKVHAQDNVAIIVKDGGLPAGALLPEGLVLREHVPQGHKVALVDIAQGGRFFAMARSLAMQKTPLAAAVGLKSRDAVAASARAVHFAAGKQGACQAGAFDGLYLCRVSQCRRHSRDEKPWASSPAHVLPGSSIRQ